MSHSAPRLPDGFVVRLHRDVEVGSTLVAGARVMRLSAQALALIVDRTVTVNSPTTATLADRLLALDLADPIVDEAAALPITVVIPVRNNAAGVDRLLGLLPGVPCIVVDDASDVPDELARVVARFGATLIRLDHNLGPAGARDVGLKAVTTELVAFVDSDVEVLPSALTALARHFADPRLAAVAPRVRTRAGSRWFEKYEASSGSLDLGPRAATVRPWSLVTYVPSACLVARVDALGTAFEPSLRSGEDVDLIWRLQDAGHRIRYAAEIDAVHDSRSTVAGWLGRIAFYGTSAAPLARRHGDRVAPAVMTTPVAIAAVGLLAGRRWTLAVSAVAAGVFARNTTRNLTGLSPRQQSDVVASTAGTMVRQTSGLMLRHWWPVSVIVAARSAKFRRALIVTALVDGLLAHRSADSSLDPVRFTLARRAADIAYGAGVWQGALRERSLRCLLPRWVSARQGRS